MAFRPLKPQYTAWARRRRLLRWLGVLLAAGVGTIVLLDHAGCFGYRGDDHARFDGRTFRVAGVTQDNAIVLDDGPRRTLVVLAGIDADGAGPALKDHLAGRASGRAICVKLEPLQTRDRAGRLLGSIYIDDTDCLNVDIVRQGLARADRTTRWMMRAAIDGAEADAQRHRRGLWKDLPQTRPARGAGAFHPD
jgi:hypothetical protein